MPPGRAAAAAQAVLDTRALDVAHEAKAAAGQVGTALDMHFKQCDEREDRSSKSRAAMHAKVDGLGAKIDQDAREFRRILWTASGAAILTLLTVIGTLITWIVVAAPWAGR